MTKPDLTRLGLVLLVRVLAVMPLRVSHALGQFIGGLLGYFPNGLRRVSLINLALCFPEQTAAWHRRIARQSLAETIKAALEAPRLWRLSSDRIRALLVDQVGEVPSPAALADKRYVLASPHLGSWEYAGLYAATFCRMTTLYRPPRLAVLEQPLRQARANTGAQLVATTVAGMRSLYQRLDAGGCLGILPDQAPRRDHGVFAPFFGLPANTMILPHRFALRYGCPVYMTFAERLPKGRGYRLHWHRVDQRLYQRDPVAAATALNAAAEYQIRRCPAQYTWSYKRFKRQPDPQQVNPYRR